MKSNLALITTLYNSKGADFYKDIYFPLIRYSVTNISYGLKEKHYDVIGLQDNIKEKAGITIPLQVLRNSIRLLSESKSLPFSVFLYSDGNYFKIIGDLGIDEEEINEAANLISSQYRRIEIFFQEYLEYEHLSSTKSLLDFFNNNSDDVLNYLEKGDALPEIDQEYVNVVRYIDWLKESKSEYYEVVNNLLWGSIVAGFLQRSNVELDINTIEKVDYYLDTSLVLSVLGLNSKENVAYAKDLIRIIKEAGSTPKVHALTIREIKFILEQVEAAQAPRVGSSIEQAWVEKDLQLSDLMHIHNNLEKLLVSEDISVFPVNDIELDRIEDKYKSNHNVKSLALQRGSEADDKLREIHDIYMRDFIQKINDSKGGASIEKQSAYFVTLNSDLISFSNAGSGRAGAVLHAAKVVMNLWLHSSKSENIRQAALAEVMSRCYALNQTDARQKLKIFYKYYKDCSLTSEDIKNMYGSLVKRSANTINAVDEIIENESKDSEEKEQISKEIIAGLKTAVEKESAERAAAIAAANQKVAELTRRTESLEQAIEKGRNSSIEKDAIIRRYEEEQGASKETIARLENELKTINKLNEINKELGLLYDKKGELEKDRDKSISYFKFWFTILFEIVASVVFIFCLVMALVKWRKESILLSGYTLFTIGSGVAFFSVVKNISNLYILAPGPSKMKVRDEQRTFWEDKHPEYKKLNKEINELEEKKRTLEVI